MKTMINQALAVAAFVSSITAVKATPTEKPTAKPTFQVWSGVGCPREWVEGSAYEAKDLATVDGVVYQCSSQE
jgi:hypothetical protein